MVPVSFLLLYMLFWIDITFALMCMLHFIAIDVKVEIILPTLYSVGYLNLQQYIIFYKSIICL